MARVYIGIGSNLDREQNIRSGVAALGAAFGPLTLSRVYRSRPVGLVTGDFFNLVAGFDIDHSVQEVADRLRGIEQAHGRRRDGGPQTLDLDLLLYDDLVLDQGRLKLPRPDITRYAFVLGPLAEINPQGRHPLLGTTFAQLWENFHREQGDLIPVALDWD